MILDIELCRQIQARLELVDARMDRFISTCTSMESHLDSMLATIDRVSKIESGMKKQAAMACLVDVPEPRRSDLLIGRRIKHMRSNIPPKVCINQRNSDDFSFKKSFEHLVCDSNKVIPTISENHEAEPVPRRRNHKIRKRKRWRAEPVPNINPEVSGKSSHRFLRVSVERLKRKSGKNHYTTGRVPQLINRTVVKHGKKLHISLAGYGYLFLNLFGRMSFNELRMLEEKHCEEREAIGWTIIDQAWETRRNYVENDGTIMQEAEISSTEQKRFSKIVKEWEHEPVEFEGVIMASKRDMAVMELVYEDPYAEYEWWRYNTKNHKFLMVYECLGKQNFSSAIALFAGAERDMNPLACLLILNKILWPTINLNGRVAEMNQNIELGIDAKFVTRMRSGKESGGVIYKKKLEKDRLRFKITSQVVDAYSHDMGCDFKKAESRELLVYFLLNMRVESWAKEGKQLNLRCFCPYEMLKKIGAGLVVLDKWELSVSFVLAGKSMPLFRSCSNLRLVTQLHAHLLVTGRLRHDPLPVTKLIESHAFMGPPDSSRLVFEAFPYPDSFIYGVVIKCNVWCHLLDTAIDLYHRLVLENTHISKFVFPSVLRVCTGSKENLGVGKKVHGRIIKSGVDDDAVIETSLLCMYGQTGNLSDAEKVFDGMPVRDLVAWSTLISSCLESGEVEEALRAFKCMVDDGVELDTVTMINLVEGCTEFGCLRIAKSVHGQITRKLFDFDETLCNSLLTMYSKCGDLFSAERIFEKVVNKDAVSWTAMISSYSQSGFFAKALRSFSSILKYGFEPDLVTLCSVLSSCGLLGSIREGKSVHGFAVRRELDPKYESLSPALVKLYAECGRLKDCELVLIVVGDRNIGSWNSLISLYVHKGLILEALCLFRQMVTRRIRPDSFTLTQVQTFNLEDKVSFLRESIGWIVVPLMCVKKRFWGFVQDGILRSFEQSFSPMFLEFKETDTQEGNAKYEKEEMVLGYQFKLMEEKRRFIACKGGCLFESWSSQEDVSERETWFDCEPELTKVKRMFNQEGTIIKASKRSADLVNMIHVSKDQLLLLGQFGKSKNVGDSVMELLRELEDSVMKLTGYANSKYNVVFYVRDGCFKHEIFFCDGLVEKLVGQSAMGEESLVWVSPTLQINLERDKRSQSSLIAEFNRAGVAVNSGELGSEDRTRLVKLCEYLKLFLASSVLSFNYQTLFMEQVERREIIWRYTMFKGDSRALQKLKVSFKNKIQVASMGPKTSTTVDSLFQFLPP